MKAIFVSDSSMDKVYPTRVVEQLATLCDLDPQRHTKQELLDNPALSQNAEALFST